MLVQYTAAYIVETMAQRIDDRSARPLRRTSAWLSLPAHSTQGDIVATTGFIDDGFIWISPFSTILVSKCVKDGEAVKETFWTSLNDSGIISFLFPPTRTYFTSPPTPSYLFFPNLNFYALSIPPPCTTFTLSTPTPYVIIPPDFLPALPHRPQQFPPSILHSPLPAPTSIIRNHHRAFG